MAGAATGAHLVPEEPLQIPPTRMPRRRRSWPRAWRVTVLVVLLAVAIVGTSAVVNHEVSRRLATLPVVTTSLPQPTTTLVAPRPKAPQHALAPDPIITVPETTTTIDAPAQEVPKAASDIIDKLDALPVRDEHTFGYARYRFGFWRDDDGDGCDDRTEVLIDQALEVVIRSSPCDVVAGEWHSRYDDAIVDDSEAMAVDHVVGLYEAWKSGAWDWTDAARNDYLNDLKTLNAMLAVSAAAAKDKAGRDPKDWMPTNGSFRCAYLQMWVDVKTAWKLAADAGEREAIAAAALNC